MKKTDRLVPFQFRILCYAFYRKCRKNNFYGSHFLMSEKYILYNPYAGGPEAKKAVKALQESNPGAAIINICRITSYTTLFNGLEPDASVILCGGDGTLNRFINDVDGIKIQNKLYYYPTGTGNDFARDVNQKPFSDPTVCLNPKPINYTKIAITGLLFHFKPKNATVIVDGKSYSYKKVWLASVMNGKFYGGGMMPTPNQDRLREDGKISVLVFHDVGKLRALMIFPSIFSGTHLKYTKQMTILEGKTIQVQLNEPTPLQIDGEVVPEALEYTASSETSAEPLL